MNPAVRRVQWTRTARQQARRYAEAGHGQPVSPEGVGRDGAYVARFDGRCTAPITMRQVDKPNRIALPGRPYGSAFTTDTVVRCRKCESCLRWRRARWASRMVAENVTSGRTWFVTLTMKDDALYRCVARSRLREGYEDASPARQDQMVFWEFGAEVTKFLKRLRKNATARARRPWKEVFDPLKGQLVRVAREPEADPRIKYVLVFEHGSEGGRHHCHLLIHEKQGRILEQEVREAWSPLGFAEAKLVRHADRAGWYAAKYLAKSLGVRVRSSLRYGPGGESVANCRLSRIAAEDTTPRENASPPSFIKTSPVGESGV